jgi:glycine/D-amino acid oxidase-like deaminating enzyme
MTVRRRVVVIGGGIAGVSAAWALADHWAVSGDAVGDVR